MKKETRKRANGTNHSRVKQHTDLQAQIELRAHALWLADSCSHGNDLSHWLQAEREVMGLNNGGREGVPTGILL